MLEPAQELRSFGQVPNSSSCKWNLAELSPPSVSLCSPVAMATNTTQLLDCTLDGLDTPPGCRFPPSPGLAS